MTTSEGGSGVVKDFVEYLGGGQNMNSMGKEVVCDHPGNTSAVTAAHHRVVVTLDLGALEISMDQLLGLRALDKITCTWDAPLSGMIRLNGAPWASVDISIAQTAQPSGAPSTTLELVVSELATCLRVPGQDERDGENRYAFVRSG